MTTRLSISDTTATIPSASRVAAQQEDADFQHSPAPRGAPVPVHFRGVEPPGIQLSPALTIGQTAPCIGTRTMGLEVSAPSAPQAIGAVEDGREPVHVETAEVSSHGIQSPDLAPDQAPIREQHGVALANRIRIVNTLEELVASGYTLSAAAKSAGVSIAKASRYLKAWREHGSDGLRPGWGRCGRKTGHTLDRAEADKLAAIYIRTNRTADSGSMRTAAKMLAHDPETSDATRDVILAALERNRVPACVARVCRRVTAVHIGQYRSPRINQIRQFSGKVGARLDDKIARRRVIESDDGTLNFAVCIPWPSGGDPCSDKYQVRAVRAQWLPQIEAGWSHMVLGYSLVFRPRGSYRNDDIRDCIYRVGRVHGLPDAYRFEHGAWESNRVTELLGGLGVELQTVDSPNGKATMEGFFSKMWTYLSVVGGQVGRYRGEHERENRLLEACRSGREDPRHHFPMLADAIRAIDGAIQIHNTDTIDSVYGHWVPQVRHDDLKSERPWRPIPPDLDYLFAPIRREWTVSKGTAGGWIRVFDGYDQVPFYFDHQDLWRINGQKVALYFDLTANPCVATIVSIGEMCGYRPGEVICRAPIMDGLPAHCRAAVGWSQADPTADPAAKHKRRSAAMAACRRETRVFASGGRVVDASALASDGRGNYTAATAATAVAQPIDRRTAATRQQTPCETVDLRRVSSAFRHDDDSETENFDLAPTRRQAVPEETIEYL